MTAGSAPVEFDVLGALPTGTTLLEASAGTGKTWTIAALVTRFVAEGSATLNDTLLITFGRAATRELRERVRERLTTARDALAEDRRDDAATHPDPVVRHLATGAPEEVSQRYARLAAATADLDAATIVTTHRFCQLVIQGLGSAADADPGTELVEQLGDLVTEVAGDLYLRKWAAGGDPAFPFADALAIARAVAGDTHAVITPDPDRTDGPSGIRAKFGRAVRTTVGERLRARRAMGFDDLLARLRDVLRDPLAGPLVADRLRAQYRLVLVDEFQDTDPVQWEILRAAFHGHAALVLIGDPKQAIYAFRGGDVHSYLEASGEADQRATLPTNFRSDPGLLAGLEVIFGGRALGEAAIRVGRVRPGRDAPLLSSPTPPLRVRVLPTPAGESDKPKANPVRAAVTADLVDQIVSRLCDGSTLRDGPDSSPRPVRPGDIAVLVRSNAQAEQVRAALVAAGVPAVLRATSSVFSTAAATDWLVLLEAIEQPHRAGRVRRLAVGGFIGLDAAALDAGGDTTHDRLAQQVRAWGVLLAEHGVAALFAAVDSAHGTLARLLAERGGERAVTDLRHVADALHEAAVTGSLGPTALLTWLRRRITESDKADPAAERSRRLDSDAAAVQVVTVHTSKGLEFPLVYLPFAWGRHVERRLKVALFHDKSGARCRDVGGPEGPDWPATLAAHLREDAGEDLRLLYVAATRARCALTMWWARSTITADSSLHRLLFCGSTAEVPADKVPMLGDTAAWTALRDRLAGADGAIALERVAPTPTPSWSPPAQPTREPVAARFDRAVDTAWRRTSYSGLTALAHAHPGSTVGPGPEPEFTGTVDEPIEPTSQADLDTGPVLPDAPAFAALPGGAAFGTLVHTVLELVDPAAEAAELTEACARALRYAPVADLDATALAAALRPVLHTPLGSAAEGRTLAGLGTADRLCELDFELPLMGGDDPIGTVRLAALAPVLEAHLDPGDPVREWVPRLRRPELAEQTLRGYLTGSIDVVLRVAAGGSVRYLVVDYKTNRLHPPGAPARLWHYRPEALVAAMSEADYPLQALLYQIALHRYLTWRQPGYDPERHLGGALYLFLRGMPGPAVDPTAAEVPGVFAWRPPAEAIVACSDLLAGGAR